jgi:TIR domain
MREALEQCRRTLAIYSPNYFNSGFCEDEWTAALADSTRIVAANLRQLERALDRSQ